VPKDKQVVTVKPDYRGYLIEAHLVHVVPQPAAAVRFAKAEIKHAIEHPLKGVAAPPGSFLGPLYGVLGGYELDHAVNYTRPPGT
jgi:hypothetical protein